MQFQNEWLEKQYYEFFSFDHGITFLKKFVWGLWLYRKVNWKWLGKLLANIEMATYQTTIRIFDKEKYVYQDILETNLKEIQATIVSAKLPMIKNPIIQDIRGFNMFNAESFPCFGDNLIAVNTGICYHCHTITRFSQPYFISYQYKSRMSKYLKKKFLDKFAKASIALIVQDHSITFSKWFFIPEDDNLLYGMEKYIICHEYAHLLFRQYDYDDFKFKSYFSTEIVDLIYTNEEIAADAVAIIILYHHMLDYTHSIYTLYAPQFLYKILSCYENSHLWSISKNHPSQQDRYQYILKMVKCLSPNAYYQQFDRLTDFLWNKRKDFVRIEVDRIRTKFKWRINVCIDLHNKFSDVYNS